MGLYDAFKDVISIAQKAGNLDIYRQLLDLSAQALELQAENAKLKEENTELRKAKDLDQDIIRHKHPFITLKNDGQSIPYCAICWAKENKLYQMSMYDDYGGTYVRCINCENRCLYNCK